MNLDQTEQTEEQALKNAQREQVEVLDAMYDESVATCGQPLQFGLFDAQLCGHLDFDWLFEQVKALGISGDVLRQYTEMGLARKWFDTNGQSGFLLFTPEQVKVAKKLRDSGRYSDIELQHIMERWDEAIRCTLEVVPYDELEVPELEVYRKRLKNEIENLNHRVKWLAEIVDDDPQDFNMQQLEEAKSRLRIWQKASRRAGSYDDKNLSDEIRLRVSRALFRERWLDEFVRVSDARTFQQAIEQGFSVEVCFNSYTSGPEQFEFHSIDWRMTLQAFQRTRSQGRNFPLRTPRFDLTESGLSLPKALSADEYANLYQRYQMDELSKQLDRLGVELWNPPEISSRPICPQCSAVFVRTVQTKQYCSDKCRGRARQRRWRDSDPERARQAQARFWKSYPHDDL